MDNLCFNKTEQYKRKTIAAHIDVNQMTSKNFSRGKIVPERTEMENRHLCNAVKICLSNLSK